MDRSSPPDKLVSVARDMPSHLPHSPSSLCRLCLDTDSPSPTVPVPPTLVGLVLVPLALVPSPVGLHPPMPHAPMSPAARPHSPIQADLPLVKDEPNLAPSPPPQPNHLMVTWARAMIFKWGIRSTLLQLLLFGLQSQLPSLKVSSLPLNFLIGSALCRRKSMLLRLIRPGIWCRVRQTPILWGPTGFF